MLCQQMLHFADDPGVGWHMATGELIATVGRIPTEDPFLSVRRLWICDQWLGDLIFFKLFRLGGWPLLYASLTVVYTISFFGILYFGIASLTGAALSVSLATFISFKLGLVHFILRPVILAFPLMAWVVLWTNRPPPIRLRLVGPALLFFVWAQVHPSFVLGLLLLLLRNVATLIDGALSRGSRGLREATLGFIMLIICAVVTVCNPQGVALHKSILSLGGSTYFMNLNSEWLPLNLKNLEGVLFLLTVGTIILGNLLRRGFIHSASAMRTYDLLTVTTFGYLTLSSVRILPFYAIAIAPALTRSLEVLTHLKCVQFAPVIRLLVRPFSALDCHEKKIFRGRLLLPALTVALLGDAMIRGHIFWFSGPYGPSSTKYPYQSVAKLVALSLRSPEPTTVITHPDWGGFVIREGSGKLKPTIDDRNTLLGEEEYRALFGALNSADALVAYARLKQADYILLPKSSKIHSDLQQALQSTPVAQDAVSIAYTLTQ